MYVTLGRAAAQGRTPVPRFDDALAASLIDERYREPLERWRAGLPPRSKREGFLQRLLARVGPSRRQRGLTLAERRRNVAGAFSARPSEGAIVLVDDVYTSGATVSAAASALRASGASTIDVVTFARTIRFLRAT